MSFENLKTNFEIYVQNFKNENSKSEEKNGLPNDETFNIFDFAEEFKDFIEDGYTFTNSINALSEKDLKDLEFTNGVLTTQEDRKTQKEEIKASASVLPDIENLIGENSTSFSESMETKESNEKTLVSLLKEISTNEEFINKLDENQDNKLNTEEFKNFIKEAQKIDGNEKDLSLKDIITGIDGLNKDKDLSTLVLKEKTSTKNTKKTPKTEMSLEELKDEGHEQLKKTLNKAKDIITGENSTLKNLKGKVDEVYNVFQEKLQEASPKLAKEHQEIKEKIDNKNKEINKNREKLLQEKVLLKNSENSYENVKNRETAYKERLSELKEKYKTEIDAKTKEEIKKHIETLKEKIEITETKKAELKEKIQARKDKIETLKTQINNLKEEKSISNKEIKAIEEKIVKKEPEIEKYLNYYNTAFSHYKEEKINAENKVKENLVEDQKSCNKNKNKYSKEIAETVLKQCKLKEYSATAGQKLLNNSINVEREMYGTGKCLTAVKSALKRAYPEFSNLISNTEGYYSAYQFAKALSGEDKRFAEFSENFKEIECSPKNIKDLPAGAIVVYSANYSKKHGHIAIMDGKGNQYSDWKGDQENLSNYYQTNFWNKGSTIRVFVPVS